MKYFNIILVVIILVLIGTGAYFFFMKPATSEETVSGNIFPEIPFLGKEEIAGPADFVSAFYAWYLPKASADISFTSTESFAKESSAWLTKDFALLATGANSEDPFTLVQDIDSRWSTNISSTLLNLTSTEALVLVTLEGDEPHQFTVSLVRSNTSGWRISDVTLLQDDGI